MNQIDQALQEFWKRLKFVTRCRIILNRKMFIFERRAGKKRSKRFDFSMNHYILNCTIILFWRTRIDPLATNFLRSNFYWIKTSGNRQGLFRHRFVLQIDFPTLLLVNRICDFWWYINDSLWRCPPENQRWRFAEARISSTRIDNLVEVFPHWDDSNESGLTRESPWSDLMIILPEYPNLLFVYIRLDIGWLFFVI